MGILVRLSVITVAISFLADSSFAKTKASEPKKIVFLGDSLTEGYGVAREEAFPQLIQNKLQVKFPKKYRVINSGVSGSTTASGLRRFNWVLKSKPEIVIFALGGNDGLRGLPAKETYKNLKNMVKKAKESGVKVVLAGMQAPPNYGKEYTKKFSDTFPRVAKEEGVAFIPFLLEGVAGEKEFNQADGIHPNAKGHIKMADLVFTHLEKLL